MNSNTLRLKLVITIAVTLIFFTINVNSVYAADCGGLTACNCEDTLIESYNMTENLDCSLASSGLIIGANDIALDCNSFAIIGPAGGNGIETYTPNRTVIQNCEIYNFANGIYSQASENVTFYNNTIHDVTNGINILQHENWASITYNNISTADYGIYLDRAYNGDIVSYNEIYSTGTGIYAEEIINAQINYNTIYDSDYGIYIYNSSACNILGNEIDNILYSGILIEGDPSGMTTPVVPGGGGICSLHTVSGNIITNPAQSGNIGGDPEDQHGGIALLYERSCILQSNIISDTGYRGISLYKSENNSILSNIITNFDYAIGIWVKADESDGVGGYNTIAGNTVNGTGCTGIRIAAPNNTIANNIVEGDGTFGCSGWGSDSTYGMALWDCSYEENNTLSNNFVSGYEWGLYVYEICDLTIAGDEYYENDYGAYLDNAGGCSSGDDILMPIFIDTIIHDNCEGLYMTASSASISDSDVYENNCLSSPGGGSTSPYTGIYMVDSTLYLQNSNFTDNGNYGIYEFEGSTSVYWILTEDVYCTNNDILILDGAIYPSGGSIIADNCEISVAGNILNFSAGQTGMYAEAVNEGTPFGSESYGVTGDISTGAGSYSGDLIVNFYDENPGASGYYLESLGLWIDATLDPMPADLTWWLLKLYYTDEVLALAGLEEDSLQIQFYNETSGTWYVEANQGVNETGNYVWANLTHFSIYGLYGSLPTIATPAVTPSGFTPSSGGLLPEEIEAISDTETDSTETDTETATEEVSFEENKEPFLFITIFVLIAGIGAVMYLPKIIKSPKNK